jgi:rod shape-determining protein MreC
MKTLIKFFLTYGIYFIFVLLEVGSLLLVVNNNHFQHSVFLTSCNKISGSIYTYNHSVIDYFRLKQTNEELSVENAMLRNRVIKAENHLKSVTQDSLRKTSYHTNPEEAFTCYSAKVINNSTNKLLNYITLNRGYKDGIRKEMTVISARGVVGIVKAVSQRFAVVMPLLNSNTKISCKLKSKDNILGDSVGVVKDIGSLVWDGYDSRFASMVQVPRHVKIKEGDRVVTSGYSDFFPEGILVGYVEDYEKASDDNYYNIKVRLAVNFKTVSYVQVLDYKNRREQKGLEQIATQ